MSFDEIDSIVKRLLGDDPHGEKRRLLNTLLYQMATSNPIKEHIQDTRNYYR